MALARAARLVHGTILAMILGSAPVLAAAGTGEPTPEITADELMTHVKFLADDDLEGRSAGSPGARMAGDYIAEEFARLGLKPAGDRDSYFQNFSLPRGYKALPDTSLVCTVGKQATSFRFERDIYPLPSSASGEVQGVAVFAGYGISAPELGYDDYEELSAGGRVVIVLRGRPNNKSKKNPFRGAGAAKRFSSFRAKQSLAAALGAAGLIVVNDPVNHSRKSDDVLVTSDNRNQGMGSIPCLHMTYAAGRKLLSNSGLSLGKTQKLIDGRLKPRSREIPNLELRMKTALEVQKLDVRNVLGLLESTSPQQLDEVLVLGAHYDHIGRGEIGSMGGSKTRGEIHNGADDNASGTSAVLEIAGFMVPLAAELKRDVLFICFTAEEMGLLGSKHYVDAPAVSIDKTAAMINLDMVSYLGATGRLEIYGTGTSPSFEKMLGRLNRSPRIKARTVAGVGSGMSDHSPFYQKGLPVLFFITGLHSNYHRPSDDWQAIRKTGFERTVCLAGRVACELANTERRPVFTPTSTGGFDTGPFLGLAVEEREGAVYVSDVARGSPASRSGLKRDDRLAEINGLEVSSVSVFYGIWAGIQPGDRVEFLVSRSGRLRTIRVRLDE